MFKLTEPNENYTIILDIGCGTGHLLNSLNKKGYNKIYGLEKSIAMARECVNKYPTLKVKVGDANDSMTFEKSTFTHIFCVGMTIYEFKDKISFFRNCYYWLKPNSYLILHLVNRNKFNTITTFSLEKIPLLRSTNDVINEQNYIDSRITNTEIEFNDFKYKSNYDFSKKDIVIYTETFLDKNTSNVRKNEKELYMTDELENILYDAQYSGFIVVSQINYKDDENQFLFILERPN